MKTLIDLAKTICSTSDTPSSDKPNLKTDHLRNGFPKHLIKKTIRECQHPTTTASEVTHPHKNHYIAIAEGFCRKSKKIRAAVPP